MPIYLSIPTYKVNKNQQVRVLFTKRENVDGENMKFVTGNNILKDLTQQIFWSEYDRLHGTNYSTTVVENINFDKLLSSAIEIIDEMDFSALD